jgi:hypothetical protein
MASKIPQNENENHFTYFDHTETVQPQLNLNPVSSDKIKNLIQKLKNCASECYDEISPKLLQHHINY